MKVIDPGHKYKLDSLDGDLDQTLIFVKRCDLNNPSRFPGNTNSYAGTTIQNVLRALLNRMRYLQNQVWATENVFIILFLRLALWLLEFRAGRRHKKLYFKTLTFAEQTPMCLKCGHTFCNHL